MGGNFSEEISAHYGAVGNVAVLLVRVIENFSTQVPVVDLLDLDGFSLRMDLKLVVVDGNLFKPTARYVAVRVGRFLAALTHIVTDWVTEGVVCSGGVLVNFLAFYRVTVTLAVVVYVGYVVRSPDKKHLQHTHGVLVISGLLVRVRSLYPRPDADMVTILFTTVVNGGLVRSGVSTVENSTLLDFIVRVVNGGFPRTLYVSRKLRVVVDVGIFGA